MGPEVVITKLWTQRRCHPTPENWVSTLQKALRRWDTLRTRRGTSAGLLGEGTKPSWDPIPWEVGREVRARDARAEEVKDNTGGSRCWKASRLPTGAFKRRQTGQAFSLEPGSLPILK